MSDDLRPCPFCGANDLTAFAAEWRECHCGATGPDGAEAWNRRPVEDALRARAEAAEARAALAEADARLMAGLAFASFVARTSFSAEPVEASLLDALEVAGDHTAAVSDADLIAAARRILAAAGGDGGGRQRKAPGC